MDVPKLRAIASDLLSGAMVAHLGKEERVGHPVSTNHHIGQVEHKDGKKYDMWVSISLNKGRCER